MGKQIIEYPHKEHDSTIKRTTSTLSSRPESQKHYPEQKKPSTKEYILYDFIYMKFWNLQ